MNLRTLIPAAIAIACAVFPAYGETIFSDDFDDVTGSFLVIDDGGFNTGGGTPANTLGGFIGSSGTGQIVVEENTGAGVDGSGAILMRIETFNGINGVGDPDDTSGFLFLGFTYADAAILPLPVTVADLQQLTLQFDYKTENAGDYTVRVEKNGGDFENRADLGFLPNTNGVFQSASFDLSLADPVQLANLAGSINANPGPVLQVVFGNGDTSQYQNNSTLIIDNIAFISVVPEPTSVVLISLVAASYCGVGRARFYAFRAYRD